MIGDYIPNLIFPEASRPWRLLHSGRCRCSALATCSGFVKSGIMDRIIAIIAIHQYAPTTIVAKGKIQRDACTEAALLSRARDFGELQTQEKAPRIMRWGYRLGRRFASPSVSSAPR